MQKINSLPKIVCLWFLTFTLVVPSSSQAFTWSGLLSDLYNRYTSQSTATKIVIPAAIAAIIGGSWWYSSYLARQWERERNRKRLQKTPINAHSVIIDNIHLFNKQLTPDLSENYFTILASNINNIVDRHPELKISRIAPEILDKKPTDRYNITKSIIYQIINKSLENNPEELAKFRAEEILNVIHPKLNAAVDNPSDTVQAYSSMLTFLDYNPYHIAPQQERIRGELAETILGLQNPRFGVNAMLHHEWLQQMRNPRTARQIEPLTQEEPEQYTGQLINIYTLP